MTDTDTNTDPIHNPRHYGLFPNMEVIDIIREALSPEQLEGYLMGNCLKYRLRAGKKNSLAEDIGKAQVYERWLWEIQESAELIDNEEEGVQEQ
jgi:hypothetical protein